MEKVSVIMPCHNDGDYIREAVSSVYQQTYKNIELIIIDDGSETHTKNILNDIARETGCTLLETEHGGPSAARNLGISKATGKYILPLDADDEIHKDYIQKAVNKIESDKQIGVVYCHAELFGKESGKWNLPEYSFKRMLVDNVVFVTALFYKSDWEKVGGFNENMVHGMEDYDFWLSILGLGKTIYQLPEVLFRYRIKEVSRTTRFKNDRLKIKETYELLYDHHAEFFKEHCETYAKSLRNALLDSNATIESLKGGTELMQKLSNLPLFRNKFIKNTAKFILRSIRK